MSKPFENAFWIWDDGDPTPVNAYRIFRKTLFVPEDGPTIHTAHICADTIYELTVNMQRIAFGPAASARGIQTYDALEIRLEPGKENIIVATVHYIGAPTFSRIRNRAGLLFKMGDVVSDSSWLIAKSDRQPSPRLSVQQGFAEFQDARKSVIDEFGPDIDSAQWAPAVEIVPAYSAPWEVMEARDIPNIPSEWRWQPYSALIGYGNCDGGATGSIAERLQNEDLRPLTSGQVEQSAPDGDGIRVVPGDKDIWLLFDMGEEVSGTVDLDIESEARNNEGGTIDIGYDEALRIGETPSGLRHGSAQYSSEYADQLILSGGDDSFWSMTPRAFRHVRLALRGLKSPLTITALGVHDTSYPVDREGVFACSDARLDRIFEIGKRTLRLCMEDRFTDCPWRERAQWIADARIEAVGARYCFGDSLLHRRFLRQTALSEHPDGRIDPVGPGEWDAQSPNMPIPGFIAIYVLSVLDYFRMCGDGALVQEVMPAVQKALGWLASYGAGEGGLLSVVPGWNFTDWAPGLDNGADGITAPVNLFYVQALRAAASLAELMGDQAAATSNRTRAEMVAAAFDSLFWNPLRGVYVDAVVSGEQSGTASQQTNSLALLSGIGSDARRSSVAQRLLSDTSLTQVGSPYFGYYLVRALSACDRDQEALNYIRARWGAMMDAGATTWWETWDGQQSRCHGWSIAPSIWLPQNVLGVTAHEPGFTCVNIAPRPCDLAWARGIVPIPQGDAQVSWLRKDNRFTLDVTVPTGVLLRPILPCGPSDQLLIDGERVAPDQIIRRTSIDAELAVLPGSGYRFEVVSD